LMKGRIAGFEAGGSIADRAMFKQESLIRSFQVGKKSFSDV
jgi:hypothetical protein